MDFFNVLLICGSSQAQLEGASSNFTPIDRHFVSGCCDKGPGLKIQGTPLGVVLSYLLGFDKFYRLLVHGP